jgi:hypothetical protein
MAEERRSSDISTANQVGKHTQIYLAFGKLYTSRHKNEARSEKFGKKPLIFYLKIYFTFISPKCTQ